MDVYAPEDDSFLMETEVKKFAKGRVLDMGTGSGIQAVAAAEKLEVREVVAVDVNKDAVDALKNRKIGKIRANRSNLFQSVKGRFDTIIFNPPYLPAENGDPDAALDGGEKGHELIEKFLKDAKSHMEKNGFILLLYSSRSGDVGKIIADEGYCSGKLSEKPLPFFEKLFVVKLTLKDSPKPTARGKRGLIYRDGAVCIKERNPDSEADSLKNEAGFLKLLNAKGIGPKFISFDGKHLKREFIEGAPLGEFVERADKEKTLEVFIQILRQCREMDRLMINKTELTNPYKDIIVTKGNKAVMIDFERCRKTEKPQNVTQFMQYILGRKRVLSPKGIDIMDDWIMLKSKKYKDSMDDRAFGEVLELFS